MSKAAEMAKVSAKGGFHLLWGLITSTVISALGTVFVGNLLGDYNYGLYTIALFAPNLISSFRDWGINVAMIKYTAQYNAENKAANIRSIFAAGIIFEIVLGLALTVVAFLLSDFLANLQKQPITSLIQIASFTILTGALLSTAQSAFIGVERMELNSITLVCQSIIKTIIVPVLVILGLGTFGAVLGYAIAFLTAGLIGILLMWTLYKNLPKSTHNKLEIRTTVKTMFNYGLPLSIAAIISGFQVQFYNFILPILYVPPNLIGNYAIANTFVVLIGFFATPITTVLFPAFSKIDAQKDNETLKNVFQFSIKYASLLVVPAASIVMTLSQPGISVLFPEYTTASLFLALLAFNYLYTALGNLSVGNLINSQGQTKFNLKLTLITSAIGFPLSFILISQFGILGLIITTLTAGIPSLIIALRWLKKQYGVTVDWSSSARILLSGATASAITYALISQLTFSKWIALIVGAAVFLFSFLLAVLLMRAINRSDINNVREMLSQLGPLRRLLNFLLNIIEKLMTILRL